MDLNKVIIAGRFTRNPGIQKTPSGAVFTDIGLAMNRRYTVDGNLREEVTFVDAEAWGKTAEIIVEHFSQGKEILIEGRLKMDQWTDKATGGKRSKLKIVVERFHFVGSKQDGQERSPNGPAPSTSPNPQSGPGMDEEADDLPF